MNRIMCWLLGHDYEDVTALYFDLATECVLAPCGRIRLVYHVYRCTRCGKVMRVRWGYGV